MRAVLGSASVLPASSRKGEVWIKEKPPKAVADNKPIPTRPEDFDYEKRNHFSD